MATVEVKCRFCQQVEYVKKHGKGEAGHQRHRCFSCQRTFQLEYVYRTCQAGIKEQVIDLTMNNAGIRDTARALHISINAVVRVLKKRKPRCVTTLPLENVNLIHINGLNTRPRIGVGANLFQVLYNSQ